jgi:hypothetical protein
MARTTSTNAHDDRDLIGKVRAWLAITIVALSVVGIAAASVVAIVYATADGRDETTQLVFSAMLPLFGTWVGTVLAFYFARENLQAATRSITATTESALRLARVGFAPETPVQDAMIPLARIDAHKLPPDGDPSAVKLSDLYAAMELKERHRIPILAASSVVLYVVHDSTIDKFAASAQENPRTFDKTIGDLVADSSQAALLEAIGFVPSNATVEQARGEMGRISNCNDVFVTATGKRDEPIIGWLTNTDLAGRE